MWSPEGKRPQRHLAKRPGEEGEGAEGSSSGTAWEKMPFRLRDVEYPRAMLARGICMHHTEQLCGAASAGEQKYTVAKVRTQ